MFVKILKMDYSFEGFEGKKVIASASDNGVGYEIRIAELYRVSTNDPYGLKFLYPINADWKLYFSEDCVELIEPALINCSNNNVGKGWSGFYDQAPIRKSKFRNH